MLYRRVKYKLYPNSSQRKALHSLLSSHHELYNAALQERRDAWRRCRVNVTKSMQEKQLTALRQSDAEFAAVNAQSQQVTLDRVDKAFKSYFRRLRQGLRGDYPRFKPLRRFRGWGYKKHGQGWRLTVGKNNRNGTLRLSGVGDALRIRGRCRFYGSPTTMEVIHCRGEWTVSVTMKTEAARQSGKELIGFDWGIENFLTLSNGENVDNPRFLRSATSKLRLLDQSTSRKKRGSNNRRHAARKAATLRRRIACRRRDFLHKTSTTLVARASLLATETLAVRNMTASAKGTKKDPGKYVRQKAALNRSILDGAPATFLTMIRYKAEEAGVDLVEVPAREVKPSQTCPRCRAVRKKTLRERRHDCACGASLHRDHASAIVCLQWALGAGNRPHAERNTEFCVDAPRFDCDAIEPVHKAMHEMTHGSTLPSLPDVPASVKPTDLN